MGAQDVLEAVSWHGCYDDGWKGLIVDAAFKHPAKYAYGLISRIYDFGLERGFWQVGDLIGDPFGGVALGGIVGAYKGLRWVGVELEKHFHELGNANIALHRYRLEKLGAPVPQLLQGDSRGFAALVGSVGGVVTSPPYAASLTPGNKSSTHEHRQELATEAGHGKLGGGQLSHPVRYSFDAQNIGNLPADGLDAVITSPPYAESVQGDHGETETAEESRAKRNTAGGSLGQSQRHGGYGADAGNIGNLKEGGLDGVVTSPPWENQEPSHAQGDPRHFGTGGQNYKESAYGQSPGQVGNSVGETYWSAMRQVYAQTQLALKPRGVLAVVVKSYVKSGQLVDLPEQTCRLLTSLGFTVFLRVRAWLVKETREPGLFGEVVTTKARKSFFRRLAESKGSPPIDFEEVIFARRKDSL